MLLLQEVWTDINKKNHNNNINIKPPKETNMNKRDWNEKKRWKKKLYPHFPSGSNPLDERVGEVEPIK